MKLKELLEQDDFDKLLEHKDNKEEMINYLMSSKEFNEKWRNSHTPWKRIKDIKRNDLCPCGSGLKWKKCTCEEYHNDAVIGFVV